MAYKSINSQPFIVPNGANGSLVTPANLGFPAKGIVIFCENLTGIPAGTTMTVQAVAPGSNTPCTVKDQNTGSTWSIPLATNGTMWILVPGAFGAQQIKVLLSQNTTQEVTFKVFGVDAGWMAGA